MRPRIRKAWVVRVYARATDRYLGVPAELEELVHASTASRARAEMIERLQDCRDLSWRQAMDLVSVRRAPEGDITLPPRHRLADELPPRLLDIVRHAYGAARGWPWSRGHFCAMPSNLDLLHLSWEWGLFTGPHGERADGDTGPWIGAFFYLTDLGREVAGSTVPTYPGERP
jgi:hypothetical protein